MANFYILHNICEWYYTPQRQSHLFGLKCVESSRTVPQHQQSCAQSQLFSFSGLTRLLQMGPLQNGNVAKIHLKLKILKQWKGRCETKKQGFITSPNAQMFYITLLWRFNFSPSQLPYCFVVSLAWWEDNEWIWNGTFWQTNVRGCKTKALVWITLEVLRHCQSLPVVTHTNNSFRSEEKPSRASKLK